MSGRFPKFEGRISPTSTWQIAITEVPAATATVNVVTAGDYYLTSTTSLLTTIASALTANATLAGTYSCTLDDDTDTATGKVTLSASGLTSFSVTWTSTDLRDILGWTGNVSGAATYTSPGQARYLWLPNTGRTGASSPEPTSTSYELGAMEVDFAASLAPSGESVRGSYSTRYRDTFSFHNLKGYKTWLALESVTNESLQKFYSDVIKSGKAFRFHPTRDDDTLYWTRFIPNGGEFRPRPVMPEWYGANSLWDIEYEMRKQV